MTTLPSSSSLIVDEHNTVYSQEYTSVLQTTHDFLIDQASRLHSELNWDILVILFSFLGYESLLILSSVSKTLYVEIQKWILCKFGSLAPTMYTETTSDMFPKLLVISSEFLNDIRERFPDHVKQPLEFRDLVDLCNISHWILLINDGRSVEGSQKHFHLLQLLLGYRFKHSLVVSKMGRYSFAALCELLKVNSLQLGDFIEFFKEPVREFSNPGLFYRYQQNVEIPVMRWMWNRTVIVINALAFIINHWLRQQY